jgi:hypothetical protein
VIRPYLLVKSARDVTHFADSVCAHSYSQPRGGRTAGSGLQLSLWPRAVIVITRAIRKNPLFIAGLGVPQNHP